MANYQAKNYGAAPAKTGVTVVSSNNKKKKEDEIELNVSKGQQMGLDLKNQLGANAQISQNSTSTTPPSVVEEKPTVEEPIVEEPTVESPSNENETDYWQELLNIANGTSSNTSDPSAIKNSAQNTYDELLNYYNQNSTSMSNEEKKLAQLYIDKANLDLTGAESLYDSYLESYKNLEDSKSAMQVARDNAYKYTQQMLNRQGFGTQGLAESTYAGIGNNYSNNISNLHQSYTDELKDAYSAYQKLLRENEMNAIDNKNAILDEQIRIKEQEKEEKLINATTNLDNVFTDSTDSSSMKTALDNYGDGLDEDTLTSYKQEYVSTMLENAKIESKTDVMYNAFGSYFMNNEVENGQIFVLQNEKGKDAHYFEYQNGSLVELKKKDVENSNKSYIHFDSKGNHTDQFALKTKEKISNANKNQNFKGWDTYPDGTVFCRTTQGVKGVYDAFESYYIKKDGKLYSVLLDGLSDVDKNKLKKTVVNFN